MVNVTFRADWGLCPTPDLASRLKYKKNLCVMAKDEFEEDPFMEAGEGDEVSLVLYLFRFHSSGM